MSGVFCSLMKSSVSKSVNCLAHILCGEQRVHAVTGERHLGYEQRGAVACQLCGPQPSQQSLFDGPRYHRQQLHGHYIVRQKPSIAAE